MKTQSILIRIRGIENQEKNLEGMISMAIRRGNTKASNISILFETDVQKKTVNLVMDIITSFQRH